MTGRRTGTARPSRPTAYRARLEEVEPRILLAVFSVPAPYPTITAAVNAANAAPNASNMVVVAPGMYHESNITITSPLTLISTGGAASTIIDGGNASTPQAGIIRVGSTTDDVTIGAPGQGFTLQNPPVRQSDQYINIIDAEGITARLTVQNNTLTGLNGVGNPFDVGVLVEGSHAGATATVQNNLFQQMWQGVIYDAPVGSGSVAGNTFQNLQPSTFTSGSTTATYEPEGVFALTYGGAANNVSGFSVVGNTFTAFNGIAVSVSGGRAGLAPAQFVGATISNNTINSIGFTPNQFRAGIVLIDDADTSAQEAMGGVVNSTVAGNTITAQVSCSAGSVGVWVLGADNNLNIHNNFLQNLDSGVLVDEQVPTAGYASGLLVNQNSITGDNIGIRNLSPNPIDASDNYWGVTDSTSVRAQANGGVNVDYNPWLGDGTDTSPAPGFQPNLTPAITDAVSVIGSDSALSGSPYTLALAEPAPPPPHVGPITSYMVNWGDGTVDTVAGPSAMPAHTYVVASQTTYPVTVTATNGTRTFQVASPLHVTVTTVPTLVVTTFTPTVSGFHARFDHAIDTGVLNLYNAVDPTTGQANTGPPDVTLVGASVGPVLGSLKLDADRKGFTFIANGTPLPPDTYTATLVSGASAIRDAAAPNAPLDGAYANSTAGSNYTTTFTVAPPAGPTVSIPDFARGPGQPVIFPAATGTGLPIRISNATNVTTVMVVLTYDPSLLTIAGATLAAGLPAGSQVVSNDTIPGRLAICVTSPTPFSVGAKPQDLFELSASVPSGAPYRAKAALQVDQVQVVANGSTSQGSGDQSVQVVTFLGNASGFGNYNSQDVTDLQRVIVSSDVYAGFGRYPLVSPLILGDIVDSQSTNSPGPGSLNSQDVTLLRRYLVNPGGVPQIPAYTGPPSSFATGPDPKLFLPKNLAGMPGQAVTVPVELLQTNTTAIGLQSFSLVIAFDPSAFQVSGIRQGSLTAGFQITERVDAARGLITISGSAPQALPLAPGALGDLARVDFTILASARTGSFAINLLDNSGSTVTSLNGGGLTLVPTPTNAGNDALDGLIAVGGRLIEPGFRPGQPLAVPTPRHSTPSAHDLAIHALAVDSSRRSTDPSGLIPLTPGDAPGDISQASTPSQTRTTPAGGVAATAHRVAFRHHALARVVAATESSH